jgi:hypothetical protein
MKKTYVTGWGMGMGHGQRSALAMSQDRSPVCRDGI